MESEIKANNLASGVHWVLQNELQVSQLALDMERILQIERNFDFAKFEPIPVIRLDRRLVMTDGHHRAAALIRNGYRALPIVQDQNPGNLDFYSICVRACRTAEIFSPKNLLNHLLPHEEFSQFWPPFCKRYQEHLAYLQDPCAYSALPLWKELSWKRPSGLEVYHQNQWLELGPEEKSRFAYTQIFFRLKHDLGNLEDMDLPPDFEFEQVNFRQPLWEKAVAQFLNNIYKEQNIVINPKDLKDWPGRGVFAPSLWFWINDLKAKQRVALAICDLDRLFNEGILEWIQVSTKYRRQGFGKLLVNHALCKLRDLGVDFATVSGDAESLYQTQSFYRACGFSGDDLWHITRS